jgi:hypothetical protein
MHAYSLNQNCEGHALKSDKKLLQTVIKNVGLLWGDAVGEQCGFSYGDRWLTPTELLTTQGFPALPWLPHSSVTSFASDRTLRFTCVSHCALGVSSCVRIQSQLDKRFGSQKFHPKFPASMLQGWLIGLPYITFVQYQERPWPPPTSAPRRCRSGWQQYERQRHGRGDALHVLGRADEGRDRIPLPARPSPAPAAEHGLACEAPAPVSRHSYTWHSS